MQNNTTLNNMTHTYRGCNIDNGTVFVIRFYTYIVTGVCSFIGNLLVILIVYSIKKLRSSTNYSIVSMSVSDILYPFIKVFQYKFVSNTGSRLSKLVGNVLLKLLLFLTNVSYGVSMLTLVVIAVYRFSAVMFPLRARVQNKRKRLLVLVLTWVIPMVMSSFFLVFKEFNEQKCLWKLNDKQFLNFFAADLSLFIFLPLLIMLVLYPLIIIRLKRHRVPGNVSNLQAVIRRQKRNSRLTMMFIVLTVAFLLCAGPYIIYRVLTFMGYNKHSCTLRYLRHVFRITTVMFPTINPVIYFIFLSSFRQGFKNIFSSYRCNRTRPQAPADNFELNNIPQGLHNN